MPDRRADDLTAAPRARTAGREERASPARWADAVRQALADSLALALPVCCAGCDEPDTSLCAPCRQELTPAVTRRVFDDGTAVWSGLVFDAVAARTLRAVKEEGRTGLARPLGAALAAAVAAACGSDAPPLLVPVPCSPASFRARGYRVVEVLAARARLRPTRALRIVRVTADQRRLDRDDRRRNVAESMAASGVAGRRVLLLDDVVTTGATLQEAARALRAAGATVIGAATVAATPRRGARRGSADTAGAR